MSHLTEAIGREGGDEGLLSRAASVRVRVNWLVIGFAAVLVVAAGMRFWDLGSRAFHHDESLHAWTAWKLFQGQGYNHEPFMHGPFQFFGTAFSFFLFGVSDYSARIFPAVFGTALVAVPFFMRRRLGSAGALLAAAGIALSPTLLYFSRFARNDIYIAVFTLGLVALLWRYVDERKPQYLYLTGLLLGLAFATKESIFIHAAVLIVFLNFWMAVHFWRQIRDHNKLDSVASGYVLALLLPLGWAVTALWPFTTQFRDRVGLKESHPAAEFLLVLGTLTLPQFAAGLQVFFGDVGGNNVLGFFIIASLVAASASVGMSWNARVWGLAALAFYVPYTLLYTTFFTELDGFYSGHWGSLDYWLDQQDVARGNQPWFYYLMLLPTYEFLPLLLAAPALFWYAFRGDAFRRFLVFWAAATIFGFSLAGEKMPWVSVGTTLPVIILAAYALGEVLTSGAGEKAASQLQAYARPLAAAGLGVAAIGFGLLGPEGGGWVAFRVLVVIAGLAGLLWLILPRQVEQALGRRPRRRRRQPLLRQADRVRALALGSLFVAGGLLTATLFVGVRASYEFGDVPRELLVYTQTSPFVTDITDSIDTAARNSGLNEELPIVVGGGIEPWAWYLRDYPRLSYSGVAEGTEPQEGAVIIVDTNSEAAMQPFADRYEQPVRFPLRWWFPEFETYKTVPTADVFKGIHLDTIPRFLDWFAADLFRPSSWDNWWDYFRHRRPPGAPANPEDGLGRLDMVAYFPKEYNVSVPTVAEPPAPPTQATPTATTAPPPELPALQELPIESVIGEAGGGPGQLNQPGGLALDTDGNLYVADVINYRVQKFAPDGTFLAEVGGRGAGQGEFEEPWGVAVDGNGDVYVADTFGHRIQKFDADLNFILAWGRAASNLTSPEQDAFWGPRDIAVDGNGDIWITDGGTNRVVKYGPTGSFIAAFGGQGSGQGQFVEPTSIEITREGDILVADSGNRRLQRFDAEFNFLAEYPVPGWLHVDSLSKPYIALLPDGGLIVSDPTQNKLLQLDATGAPIATLDAQGAPLALPRGLAFDGRTLYVAEATPGHITRLDLSALLAP